MIGQTMSHYRVTGQLGEAGMGVVYKAEDTQLERTVALKFLAAHLLNDEQAKARFLREAKAAAGLHRIEVENDFSLRNQPLDPAPTLRHTLINPLGCAASTISSGLGPT